MAGKYKGWQLESYGKDGVRWTVRAEREPISISNYISVTRTRKGCKEAAMAEVRRLIDSKAEKGDKE
jgi:hypothetical protein